MIRLAGTPEAPAASLSDPEFAAAMARFEPFEPGPDLAVAVSGGADSLALVLLAERWTRHFGGRLTALTVDHRLRPEAAAEAARVAEWLSRLGIPHRTLTAAAPPPCRNLQAAARALRYRLLEEWCAGAGVLHLLMAHHREDQAETLLLRLARGSGLGGLAGMAPVVERAQCRVLRPLLEIARARLAAVLTTSGQPWIEDPSNRNRAYGRVRLRESAALLAAEGLTPARLAATAARLGRARAAVETAVAGLLARAASLHPVGFARLDAAALAAASEEVALRALAALFATVAGSEYPPRLDALERLHRRLSDGLVRGATLGGCRILPRRGGLLVCREYAAVVPPQAAPPGSIVQWDGRFRLSLPMALPPGVTLAALGDAAMPPVAAAAASLPACVRATLPALRDAAGLLAVPHLRQLRPGADPDGLPPVPAFRPTRPLGRAGFTVV